jgi:hypothetical protein
MKATIPGGDLNPVSGCYIEVGPELIPMGILPDISDTKSVNYANENAIGRTAPFTLFANGELRSVSWTCHFIVKKKSDIQKYLGYIRTLQSACYPENQEGHPPPICRLQCGKILSAESLCAVLKRYSIKFDTNVPWDETDLIPYKLDIDLDFDIVYDQSALPIASDIMGDL